MGISNISALFPEDFPISNPEVVPPDPDPTPEPDLTVTGPDTDGSIIFIGADDKVTSIDSDNFQLSTPLVTDVGDGSYSTVA